MANFKKVESKNKYAGKVECPGCKSMNTIASSFSINAFGLGGLCLLSTGIAIWIPVLGWIAIPILILMSIACFIVAIVGLVSKTYTFKCIDCNSKYKIDKKEYNNIVNNKS